MWELQNPVTQSVPRLQPAFGRQGEHTPPQSTSDSLPLRTPSPHSAARQVLARHTPLVQSASLLHAEPWLHAVGQLPPQSMPPSSPFWRASLQVGTLHVPDAQSLLAQFSSLTQRFPAAQRLHAVSSEPQSTSGSSWFRRPSEHVACWHIPRTQTVLWQSFSTLQIWPAVQDRHSPPQSTSASPSPSFLSVQWVATQRFLAELVGSATHTSPESQFLSSLQSFPALHGLHSLLPQSTSDSPWSRVLFAQPSGTPTFHGSDEQPTPTRTGNENKPTKIKLPTRRMGRSLALFGSSTIPLAQELRIRRRRSQAQPFSLLSIFAP